VQIESGERIENMDNCKKTIVFAPHDDGGGAFGVLCRLARALVRVVNEPEMHLYFLNSSQAASGQDRLNELTRDTPHEAFFVPTNNLIWLPKDEEKGIVIGEQIPDILRKWVRPLWHSWPCEPNWIHPNLPIMRRKDWIYPEPQNKTGSPGETGKRDGTREEKMSGWRKRRDLKGRNPESQNKTGSSEETWEEKMTGWRKLQDLNWKGVALGISMGVPQLHRVARQEGFPSVEVGDWFFSVGLRGCMQESFVPPEIIATTEPDLRMIEKDEFKAREVWLTLYQAPHRAYKAHVANSPVKFNEMDGILWTGGDSFDLEKEKWKLAEDLEYKIRQEIKALRKSREKPKHVAYIIPGDTGVWKGVIEKLNKQSKEQDATKVAIIKLERNGAITLFEDGGKTLGTESLLEGVLTEERRLATARASDFGVVRSAGGVLCFAAAHRPSVFVDEPGHWLGRIQREQCQDAGLCVVVPIEEFRDNPAEAIQKQADKLNTNSYLDQTAKTAENLQVGAEKDLAEYLFKTYIK